jgi:hypothetical protein
MIESDSATKIFAFAGIKIPDRRLLDEAVRKQQLVSSEHKGRTAQDRLFSLSTA